FRIDSNMYPIFSRQGVLASDGGIDVKVKNENGATLSSLYDCSGNPVKITGIHPTNSIYFVPSGTVTCVWDTGNSAYRTGSYTIWAECNVNEMMDNLGEIPGATITDPIGTMQNTQTQTPTATASVTQTVTKTPTEAKTQAPTQVIAATETQTAKATAAATKTAAKTQTETQSTAQLPQTPLGLFGVFMALALVSALAVIKRR
ncbi:MAG: DUF3821 domain-containing protein, partial [Methanomicrobium sp.]|nr:DUF3821 domain-containing protein [Methanomicrobium sp.]